MLDWSRGTEEGGQQLNKLVGVYTTKFFNGDTCQAMVRFEYDRLELDVATRTRAPTCGGVASSAGVAGRHRGGPPLLVGNPERRCQQEQYLQRAVSNGRVLPPPRMNRRTIAAANYRIRIMVVSSAICTRTHGNNPPYICNMSIMCYGGIAVERYTRGSGIWS